MIDNLTDLYTYYNTLNYIMNYGIDAQFDDRIYSLFAAKSRAADVKNIYSIIREPYRMANNKKIRVSSRKNSPREIDAVIDYENNDRWTNYMYTWYGASKITSGSNDINNGRIDTFSLYEKALDSLINTDKSYRYSEDDIIPGIAEEITAAYCDNSRKNNQSNNISKISMFVKECFNKGIFKYCDGVITLHHNIFDDFREKNLLEQVYNIADIFSCTASLGPIGYFLKRNIKRYTEVGYNSNFIYIKGSSMYYSFCNELIYRALYAAASRRYVVINNTNYVVKKIYLKQDGMFETGEYPYLLAYNQTNGRLEEIALNEEYLEIGDRIKISDSHNISKIDEKVNTEHIKENDKSDNNTDCDMAADIVNDTAVFYINQRISGVTGNNHAMRDYIKERVNKSRWKCTLSHIEKDVELYDVYSRKQVICDKAYYNIEYRSYEKNDFIKWINSFGNYAEYKADAVYIFDESEKKIDVSKRENSNFDKSLFAPWYSVYLDDYKAMHGLFMPSTLEVFWLNNVINRYRDICTTFVNETELEQIEDIIQQYIDTQNYSYNDNLKREDVFNPFICTADTGEQILQTDEKIKITAQTINAMRKVTEWIKSRYIIEYDYTDYYGNVYTGVIYPYRIEIDLFNQKTGLMAYDLVNEKNVYILINKTEEFENVKRYENIAQYYKAKGYNKDEIFLKEIFYFNNMFCRSDECDRVTGLLSLFKTWDYEKNVSADEIMLSHSLVKRDASKFKNDYYNILSSVRKETLGIQNKEEVPVEELCETYEQIVNSTRYENCDNIAFFRKEIERKYGYYYNYVKKSDSSDTASMSRYELQQKEYTQFTVTPAEIRYAATTIRMYQYIYEYMTGYTDSNKRISEKKKERCNEIFTGRYSDILREEIIYRSETLKLMMAKVRIKRKLSIALANQIRNDLREFEIRILPDETDITFILEITYESYKYRKLHMIILSWGDNVEVTEPLGLKKVIEQRKN